MYNLQFTARTRFWENWWHFIWMSCRTEVTCNGNEPEFIFFKQFSWETL